MKTIRHVFLDSDPFEFCHACNYKTRWQCVQEKVNVLEPSKRLDMLRKNLTWVMQRALIILRIFRYVQNDAGTGGHSSARKA